MIPLREKEPTILRVAAYCRVSSDSSDQLHSYASQIRKYTEEIGGHDGWELVDIYADEGLTGTRMDKREDFNRMLSDCRKGRIDKILVKSVSRFARNTKDCLVSLRELTTLGVSVYFEKENIHSETLTTELMVSVSGALAQQESLFISQNQRISYLRRMEQGKFITCAAPLGYHLVGGKNLEIAEVETGIVRWIFDSYLAGHSAEWIAGEMTRRRIPTAWGRGIWREQTIRKIMSNEKYIGDSLCRKSYTTDTFPYVRRMNKGNVDQYYTENSHPAIIDREAFEKAQILMRRRGRRASCQPKEYPLSKKIICGECGSIFTRKVSRSGCTVWVCRRHDRRSSDCPVGRIAESPRESRARGAPSPLDTSPYTVAPSRRTAPPIERRLPVLVAGHRNKGAAAAVHHLYASDDETAVQVDGGVCQDRAAGVKSADFHIHMHRENLSLGSGGRDRCVLHGCFLLII